MFQKRLSFLFFASLSAYGGKTQTEENGNQRQESPVHNQEGVLDQRPVAPAENPENQRLEDQVLAAPQEEQLAQQTSKKRGMDVVFRSKNLTNMLLSLAKPAQRAKIAVLNKKIYQTAKVKYENPDFFSQMSAGLAYAKPGFFYQTYRQWGYAPESIEELAQDSFNMGLLRKGPMFLDLTGFVVARFTEKEAGILQSQRLPIAGADILLYHEALWPSIISLSIDFDAIKPNSLFLKTRELFERFAEYKAKKSADKISLMLNIDADIKEEEAREELYRHVIDFTKLLKQYDVARIKELTFKLESGITALDYRFINTLASLSAEKYCQDLAGIKISRNSWASCMIGFGFHLIGSFPHLELLETPFIGANADQFSRLLKDLPCLKEFSCKAEGEVTLNKSTWKRLRQLPRAIALQGSFNVLIDVAAGDQVSLLFLEFLNHFTCLQNSEISCVIKGPGVALSPTMLNAINQLIHHPTLKLRKIVDFRASLGLRTFPGFGHEVPFGVNEESLDTWIRKVMQTDEFRSMARPEHRKSFEYCEHRCQDADKALLKLVDFLEKAYGRGDLPGSVLGEISFKVKARPGKLVQQLYSALLKVPGLCFVIDRK